MAPEPSSAAAEAGRARETYEAAAAAVPSCRKVLRLSGGAMANLLGGGCKQTFTLYSHPAAVVKPRGAP